MGESGQVTVSPGAGKIRSKFEDRGMAFSHEREVTTASYYSVELEATEGGKIFAEQSASAYHVCWERARQADGWFVLSFSSWTSTFHIYEYERSLRPSGSHPSFCDWLIEP